MFLFFRLRHNNISVFVIKLGKVIKSFIIKTLRSFLCWNPSMIFLDVHSFPCNLIDLLHYSIKLIFKQLRTLLLSFNNIEVFVNIFRVLLHTLIKQIIKVLSLHYDFAFDSLFYELTCLLLEHIVK